MFTLILTVVTRAMEMCVFLCSERLAREREILEERAERRLEIFKDLIDKMTKAGTDQDAQDMVSHSLSSFLGRSV